MTTTPRTFDRRIAVIRLPAPIESVGEVPGRPAQRRVRAGGRTLVDLPVEVVTRLGVDGTAVLDDSLCAAIRTELRRHGLRRRALRLLARRAWGRVEVRERLSAIDGVDADDVEGVAAWLESEGLLDDRQFAEEVCRSVTRRGPVGAGHLESLLESKGVAPDVAATAAREAVGDADPFDAALQLAGGQMRRGDSEDHLRQARRIAGTLSRRGFDDETIERVLERLSLMPEPE